MLASKPTRTQFLRYGEVDMRKSERFGFVLSEQEREMLLRLAEIERLPAAAVVRRAIWRAAGRCGVLPIRQAAKLGRHDEQRD